MTAMDREKLVGALRAILDPSKIVTCTLDRVAYAADFTKEFSPVQPDVVLFAESAEDVSRILGFASENRVPVVPRGAGTNITGGTIPVTGGIVLELSRMDRILEIDTNNMLAVVQPGVVTGNLQREVARKGLFYPPDPGSLKVCTIGGNVATNAGGTRAFKYGVTRDYVMGLEAVFADGLVQRYGGRTIKNVTGYDMTRLLVGSEGTLAVVTEVILRLIPMPPCSRTFLGIFGSVKNAASAADRIIADRVRPVALEYIDTATIQAIEAYTHLGTPPETRALLIVELDGRPGEVEEDTCLVRVCFRDCGALDIWVADSDAERERIMHARRSILPALTRVKPDVIDSDTSVPRSAVGAMITKLDAISEKYGITIANFGHAGDGNLHPAFLYDAKDRDETARMLEAYREMFSATLAMGGTTTGEQGIGLQKREFMIQELGEAGVAKMRAIKTALDPHNILNPNKVFRPYQKEIRANGTHLRPSDRH